MKKINKILMVCPTGFGTTKNGRDLAEAFISLGYDVQLVNSDCRPLVQSLTPKFLRNKLFSEQCRFYFNEYLLKQCARLRPDMVFAIKPVNIFAETVKTISSMGIMTCSYWIDDPLDFERAVVASAPFDIHFTNDRGSVANYAHHGIKAQHLPSAVNPTLFYPLKKAIPRYSLSFVGTFGEYRRRILNQVVMPVHAFGPGWKKNICANERVIPMPEVFGEKTNQVFNHSHINLNVHTWNGVGTAMNLRLFEVPAAGGFLLTDSVDEIGEYFTPGTNIETWRCVDELNDKIRFYQQNPVARERITTASREHVLKNHIYQQRCQQILADIAC
ncbi:CgeB family protein [Dickeya oryzae]|uniref:CgeB family protein n=1 Tax=Dickeya oryzae TaxID=1240404 RepID=UPI001AECFB7C|nr:glycosyltransferase [Dickeya oryzae]MBP2850979.1 glycosyltransferase [Dickeya oryzae]